MKKMENEKFYTGFVIVMGDRRDKRRVVLFHCTHKFLGALNVGQLKEVDNICSNYFEQPKIFPLAIFNQKDMFGDEVVLKSFIHTNNFFLDLREMLVQFRADDADFEFTPHITLKGLKSDQVKDGDTIMGTFLCYALMSGDKIWKYWRNPKCLEKRNSPKQTALAPTR
jgi:2'-5' RNA ligase